MLRNLIWRIAFNAALVFVSIQAGVYAGNVIFYIPWMAGAVLNHYGLLAGLFKIRLRIDGYSYPLYLIHCPVIVFVGYQLNSFNIKLSFFDAFLVLATVAVIAGIILSMFFDRLWGSLRNRIFRD